MFDKRKEFHMIDSKLNDIRIHCNRLQIPFIWVAAVHDDGNETEYRVAIDENQNGEETEEKEYICQGLTPGSLGISLKDDKIRDIIKVLNGFRVTSSENPIPFDLGDFTVDAVAKASQGIYKQDEDGLLFDDPAIDEFKDNIEIPVTQREELKPQPPARMVIQSLVEEQNPNSVTLHIGKNTDLPYIDSDFE